MTLPVDGGSKPAMMLKIVLLPQPEGPINETNLPAGTSRSTGASAVNDEPLASKTIETSLSTSRGCLFISHSTNFPELNCAHNEAHAQCVPKLSFLSHDRSTGVCGRCGSSGWT